MHVALAFGQADGVAAVALALTAQRAQQAQCPGRIVSRQSATAMGATRKPRCPSVITSASLTRRVMASRSVPALTP
jgi:hypothetical protein